ncbi:MAG: hydroxyacylglutathione hydrolase [Pseudomonadota bacterium]
MPIEIVTLPARSDNYAYLIHDPETGETVSIDAPEERPIFQALQWRKWELTQIWLTHHHADHTDAVAGLRDRYRCKVVGHAKDAARLPKLDLAVNEGDKVKLGNTEAVVLDVSGHTIGHIAFHFPAEKAAFTADSLMALGCGRVFEGTHAMMWDSLSKFFTMDPETQIFSGHNYGKANGRFAMSIEPSNPALIERLKRIEEADEKGKPIVPVTLAEELATNPFLRAREETVKAAIGLGGADDAGVFAEIRRRKDAF